MLGISLQRRYMYDENKGKKLGSPSAVYCAVKAAHLGRRSTSTTRPKRTGGARLQGNTQ